MNTWTTPTFCRLPRDSLRTWTVGSSSRRSATVRQAPFGRPRRLGHVVELLARGQLSEVGRIAADVGEPDVGRRGLAPAVVAKDGRPAGGRSQEAEQDPDRRGLAGAVRAEEAEDLAFVDLEIHVLDAATLAVSLREADGLDHIRHPGAFMLPRGDAPLDYRGRRGRSTRAGPTDSTGTLGRTPSGPGRPGRDPSSTSAGAFAPWR